MDERHRSSFSFHFTSSPSLRLYLARSFRVTNKSKSALLDPWSLAYECEETGSAYGSTRRLFALVSAWFRELVAGCEFMFLSRSMPPSNYHLSTSLILALLLRHLLHIETDTQRRCEIYADVWYRCYGISLCSKREIATTTNPFPIMGRLLVMHLYIMATLYAFTVIKVTHRNGWSRSPFKLRSIIKCTHKRAKSVEWNLPPLCVLPVFLTFCV